MATSRKNEHQVLRLPARITAGHASLFRNGVVWHAWDRAEAKAPDTVRKRRAAARRRRDKERAGRPLPGDPILLDRCGTAVAAVRALLEDGAPCETIAPAADEAAAHTFAAIMRDPAGAPDLTDVLEGLADTLTERPDTQFCVPHILTGQASLWAKDGEPDVAAELLESTLEVLNHIWSEGINRNVVARNLALAYSTKSDLHELADNKEGWLLASKRAWEWAQSADATYKLFTIRRYRRVLQQQDHSSEVIHAAVLLEQQLTTETAGQTIDWILQYI